MITDLLQKHTLVHNLLTLTSDFLQAFVDSQKRIYVSDFDHPETYALVFPSKELRTWCFCNKANRDTHCHHADHNHKVFYIYITNTASNLQTSIKNDTQNKNTNTWKIWPCFFLTFWCQRRHLMFGKGINRTTFANLVAWSNVLYIEVVLSEHNPNVRGMIIRVALL